MYLLMCGSGFCHLWFFVFLFLVGVFLFKLEISKQRTQNLRMIAGICFDCEVPTRREAPLIRFQGSRSPPQPEPDPALALVEATPDNHSPSIRAILAANSSLRIRQ